MATITDLLLRSLNNLLYGDKRLTFEQNKNIFLCVQRYIASTNRYVLHFNYRLGEEFIKVLSNLFSNPFSMYLYRCVLPCVNTYLEINTVETNSLPVLATHFWTLKKVNETYKPGARLVTGFL